MMEFAAPIYQVSARIEVILSAGAINSPMILMLSGIGDPAVLAPLGIKTLVENIAVGKNLTVYIIHAHTQTANLS